MANIVYSVINVIEMIMVSRLYLDGLLLNLLILHFRRLENIKSDRMWMTNWRNPCIDTWWRVGNASEKSPVYMNELITTGHIPQSFLRSDFLYFDNLWKETFPVKLITYMNIFYSNIQENSQQREKSGSQNSKRFSWIRVFKCNIYSWVFTLLNILLEQTWTIKLLITWPYFTEQILTSTVRNQRSVNKTSRKSKKLNEKFMNETIHK